MIQTIIGVHSFCSFLFDAFPFEVCFTFDFLDLCILLSVVIVMQWSSKFLVVSIPV
jgi:hypothetical protein